MEDYILKYWWCGDTGNISFYELNAPNISTVLHHFNTVFNRENKHIIVAVYKKV